MKATTMNATTYQYAGHHYTSQGTAQGTDRNGSPKAQMRVLAYSAAASGGKATPDHAQVVLLGAGDRDAEPLAFFTADEARQMAYALNYAANAAVSEAADC